ncbi:MAG: nucleotidyltransferase family protein [Myxococcales bacterium]|nr:MAG: nucleotidyltransferase family protein [Myxococcales bacterium]
MTVPLGIVLAAGEGRRMGGPKALLVIDGKPLVLAHVQRLQSAGCRPILVVVRATIAGQVQELLGAQPEAQLCTVDTFSMAESLSAALGSVSPRPERSVVVAPVDTLPVQLATLQALLQAVTAAGVHAATPRYQGRGGHPVVALQSLLQKFRDGYSGTLRDLLRSAEAGRRWLDVEDPAVTTAFDTPADLAARRLRPRFASTHD